MHSPTALLILSLTLRALPVLSLVHPGPRATHPALNLPHSVGWTPKPTTAPIANSPLELHRRQSFAAINTCGWVDGNAADPYYCADGYACSANFPGAYFGCCETDSAGNFLSADCAYIATPYTGCYDYTSASACTGACYTQNRVCDFSYPYCAMATINMGSEILTNYDCSTEIYVRALDVETTVLFTSSIGSSPSSATSASSADTGITLIIKTSSTATTSSSAAAAATSSLAPSSSSPAPTPTVTPKPSTSHTAAIAGGVVGGLAGLVAVLGGVIFWLHKRKQTQRKAVAPEISQTM